MTKAFVFAALQATPTLADLITKRLKHLPCELFSGDVPGIPESVNSIERTVEGESSSDPVSRSLRLWRVLPLESLLRQNSHILPCCSKDQNL